MKKPNTTTVTFRLPDTTRNALNAIKDRDGIPVSEQLRRALDRWVDDAAEIELRPFLVAYHREGFSNSAYDDTTSDTNPIEHTHAYAHAKKWGLAIRRERRFRRLDDIISRPAEWVYVPADWPADWQEREQPAPSAAPVRAVMGKRRKGGRS